MYNQRNHRDRCQPFGKGGGAPVGCCERRTAADWNPFVVRPPQQNRSQTNGIANLGFREAATQYGKSNIHPCLFLTTLKFALNF